MDTNNVGQNGPEGNTTTGNLPEPVVFERGGHAMANSLDVAGYFEKNHQHVMRDIRTLLATEHASKIGLMFRPTAREVVVGNGGRRLDPAYDMDRDGFTLLAMGFTGARSLEFKLRYIDQFNKMESAIKGVTSDAPPPSPEPRVFPDWPLDELRTKKGTADLYRMVYGPLSAQWVMPQLGFPTPPRNLIEVGRQMDLFVGIDDMSITVTMPVAKSSGTSNGESHTEGAAP